MKFLESIELRAFQGGASDPDELPYCKGQSWGAWLRDLVSTCISDYAKTDGKSQFGL